MNTIKMSNLVNIFMKILFSLFCVGMCVYGVFLYLQLSYITEYRRYERVQTDDNVYWPEVLPWLYFGVGIVLGVLNICCVCATEHRSLHIASCIFLSLSVLVLVSLAVITVTMYKTEMKVYIKKNINDVFDRMVEKDAKAEERFHEMEYGYHCCGKIGISDYTRLFPSQVPERICCDKTDNSCKDQTQKLSWKGCHEVIVYDVFRKYTWAAMLCSVIALVGLVDLVLNVFLLSQWKKKGKDEDFVSMTKKSQEQY